MDSPAKAINDLHGVVIGLGSIGNRHLNNLRNIGVGKLTVVRRPHSQNSHFVLPENVLLSHSMGETLSTNPDFAIVCNPSHLHAETATQCLKAGVHVLIEKPLGKDIDFAEKQLVDFAATSDRICAMAYCMRFHPAYAAAYQQVTSGKIGRCLYAKAWFEGYLPDWHPWEDYKQSYAALTDQGGGVLRTLDHEADFLNWVLGPAETATGYAINTDGIGIQADDLAMYQLRHPNGVHSQVTSSFCRKPQSRGFEFIGSEATLEFEMERGQLLLTSHVSGSTQTVVDLKGYDINQMYLEMVNDYLLALIGQRSSTSLALLPAGLDCLRLIQMIKKVPSCPN